MFGRYDQNELYELWQRFKDNEDALDLMCDFSYLNRLQAAELISEFEARYSADRLNMENRGKEYHSGRVIH